MRRILDRFFDLVFDPIATVGVDLYLRAMDPDMPEKYKPRFLDMKFP